MAIRDWIDVLAGIWEIEDPNGVVIHSFRMIDPESREYAFPEIINEYPSVLNYTVSVDVEYSQSGPQLAYWNGISDFYLVPSLDKVHIPYVMDCIKIVYKQAANNFQLGGIVEEFHIFPGDGGPSILGPAQLEYGQEAPCMGIRAHWFVKEQIVNEIEFGV